MKFLKFLLYFLILLPLQIVVLPSFNYFGVVPDLFLVSIVAFAVLEERLDMVAIISALGGLIVGFLSTKIYFDLLSKVAIGLLAHEMRDRYFGEKYSLTALLVFLLTPVFSLIQGVLSYTTLEWFKIMVATIYNLLMVPILWPVARGIFYENQ